MRDLEIVNRPIASLRPRARNPRTHSKKQIGQIASSIRNFGFIRPVLIGANSEIIAGHGSIEAAKLVGMTEVPAVRVDHLSEEQIRAYVIADNKLAENSGWDRDLLRIELLEIEANLEVGIPLLGFETAEVDAICAEGTGGRTGDDDVPSVDVTKPAVSRVGDLWKIGRHRVLCGDALKPESYARLLNGERAQMVFTDPPYNVRIDGHASGLGRNRHAEFDMASGEMDEAEFAGFLASVFANLAVHSADGSIHYICMDWRHLSELLKAALGPYRELKNLCVWAKTNGGMGSFYRSQHELVFVFKNGTAPHINNVELGKHGRYRTNVWNYAGVNTFSRDRDAELAMHPTVKPVAMIADAILDASERNGIVFDAFGGSGSTLVAAERTGRRGYALEISPHYVDTIVRRVSEAAGVEAVLAGTNQTFEQVRRWRASGLDGEV